MTNNNNGVRNWLLQVVITCCVALTWTSAAAVEVTINAEFKMSSSGGERRFRITTPSSGLCVEAPRLCRSLESSVMLPQLHADYKEFMPPESIRVAGGKFPVEMPDPVESLLPQEKKTRMTHETSGASYPVTFAPRLLNARLETVFNDVRSGYRMPHGTCWTLHDGACRQYAMDGSDMKQMDQFSLAYQIHTPDPQTMLTGVYKARVEYSVGPDMDWSFGRYFKVNDSRIVVNLVLTVVTDIAVEAVGNKVVLYPVGGWERWFANPNSVPEVKYDLPFYLTTSTPFRVYLDTTKFCTMNCLLMHDRVIDNVLAISDSVIVLEVAVTLPFVDLRGGNFNIRNRRLPIGKGVALRMVPQRYLYRQRSLLHLRVGHEHAKYMLAHRGGTYRSQIRVMFDADL